MVILKIIFIILILCFPITEVGRIQFQNGVAFSINDILLTILLISWLVYRIRNRKINNKNNIEKPLFIFTGVAILSLVLNLSNLSVENFLISFLYLARWILYASIFFIVRDFDKKFKNIIPYLLLFSGILVTIIGYVQYFYYPNLYNLFYLGWDSHLYRMFSSFLDPNFAGAFFVLLFMLLAGLLYKACQERNHLESVGLGILGVLILAAVYLTYSRSALVMLLISVSTFLFLLGRKKIILISILILLAIIFLIPKSFQTEGTNLLRVTSSQERISSFQTGLRIFESSPLYGVGFNAYRYAQNRIGLNNMIWQITHSGAGTDSSLLFVLATTGIIGLASYMYLLFRIFLLARKNLKNSIFAVILISSLVGLLFNSLFINSLFYVFIMEWVWIEASLIESK